MNYSNSIYSIQVLILFLFVPSLIFAQQQKPSGDKEHVEIYKKPGCMCCDKWADYLKENGFTVNLTPIDTLQTVKRKNNITEELRSCHTAFIDGYVVEGHVPIEAINKLLKEQPDAIGITVPGMPTGTPGMGMDGTPYNVFLFDEEGKKSVYGKF
ncbi:MAG: DUF411 domain-containing protein [Balneolaceae bacterium]|nr:DUF411 domain-containing protein [Balneolaceae bacterium]